MARVDRASTSLGACYLDLDHFKPVNDTHGHPVGDEVLVSVADRLRQTCRQGDVAARLGGDEFVVIIEHVTDDKEVEAFTDRLGNILAAPHTTSVGAIRVPGHHRLGPQRRRANRAGCSCAVPTTTSSDARRHDPPADDATSPAGVVC